MQPLEIDEPKDAEDALVGDSNQLKNLPFQSLTKGIKPSVLKRRAQLMIIAFPIIFFIVSCVFTGYQIYWTRIFNTEHPYTTISNILYRLQDINCNHPMISDIKVISAEDDCDAGYEDKGIGTWAGTVSGCHQPSSGTISRKPCPRKPTHIAQRPSRTLHQWKNSKFCIKSIQNYREFNKTAFNEKTPQKCAAEPSDFYIPNGQNCPISDIRVVSQSTTIPPGYKSQPLSDGNYLIFTTNASDPHNLVEINIELSNKPCLNPMVSPPRLFHEAYPLSRKSEEGCGKYGSDEDTVILDTTNPLTLYHENGLKATQEKLPSWKVYHQQEQVVLYAKFRDGFLRDPKCNFCKPEYSLIPCAEQLKISEEDMSTYVLITNFILVLQVLLIAYNIMKYIQHSGDYKALFADVGQHNTIFYIVNVWFFAMQIIISTADYTRLKEGTEKIKWIEELNCFKNEKLNELFDILRGGVLDNSKDVLQDCLMAELIAILCAAGFLFAYKINKALITKEPESEENNIATPQQKALPIENSELPKAEATTVSTGEDIDQNKAE